MPEYLGSWVDTSTKRAITSFVASVTDHDLNGGGGGRRIPIDRAVDWSASSSKLRSNPSSVIGSCSVVSTPPMLRWSWRRLADWRSRTATRQRFASNASMARRARSPRSMNHSM